MSIEPFNRLVKLAARAFYDNVTTKAENQPKMGRGDNKGIAVVVLDALTRRQWVREEDLAKELKLHSKQLRRTLRLFEEEKLITREYRKETAKGAKLYNAAVAATVDGQPSGKEGEEKVKLHTHSYYCLDYAQIYDVVRYRLHRMKKKLKDELEDKNTVQEYVCPGCSKRDDNARRRRRENLKDMLQKMEVQLKPLMEQINRVKDMPIPEFGTLLSWETRVGAAGHALNGAGSNDPYKNSQGYCGTPMPFLGDTKVEVAFSGLDSKEDVKTESASTSLKVLPPWMIKQGMNLTKEQRGEVKQESKAEGSSSQPAFSDDKKSTIGNDDKKNVQEDDKKNIQDEYLKAYYAALYKKQQELEEAEKKKQQPADTSLETDLSDSTKRQVGMKVKREDNDEEDDDINCEEDPFSISGSTTNNYKVDDLNVEAWRHLQVMTRMI
ncbi:hypothetical protein ES332_A07G096000v1 [Gossypium tomentosum]|uniref:HTH TFE/IIEalpha-type domain-containing protein n=1 Tax=Gossypium tomentosum TaxID=34277 RepID=A0A5D2PQ94_GOSTO|nr:hypothetical protein ES332_A07G096000v1 [Gossypium tomentosum]